MITPIGAGNENMDREYKWKYSSAAESMRSRLKQLDLYGMKSCISAMS